MENNNIVNTEEVIETEQNKTTNADEELFAKLDEILEKRSKGIIKSVLKDNGTEDAEIGEILNRYKASKQSAKTKEAETLSTLQSQNAELSKQLFDIKLNELALKVAAEIGMNVEKLPYAMKLADVNKAVNDGNIDNEALKSALEDVLKNIPEFKSKQEDKDHEIRRIGVENNETETTDAISKMRKALGLQETKK